MDKFLSFFAKKRLLTAVIAFAVSLPIAVVLQKAEIMSVSFILWWMIGLGVFIVLSLHAKSFFSTDDLGRYYSRLYGFGSGLAYSGIVFKIFDGFSSAGDNTVFIITAYATVLATGLYNFLINNYAGLEKDHLIARRMLEKQMLKDEEQKKLAQQKKLGIIEDAPIPKPTAKQEVVNKSQKKRKRV
ncbi:hypothetical protein [Acinetobacter sp. P1(2025)]|uniref:hypothetical protein n=1 Tax=Acinetobacter sp. P1(2025) TaxID=3446120 RepID=UPI003F5384CB